MQRFEGRVAVVTGAGQGIGKGAAERLAEEGASVVVVDRNAAAANAAAAGLAARGGASLPLVVDVADPEQIRAIVPATRERFGRIDVLVNCAGIHRTRHFEEMTPAAWDEMLNVNLRGTFFCCQEVGRAMVEQQGGRIVNIASIGGKRGSPGSPHYSASKAGVISVTRSAALTFAPHVNVNAICPGYVITPMSLQTERESVELEGMAEGDRRRRLVAEIPLRRTTTPEELAGVIAFLASDEAAYITGQAINFDGGWHMD